jgi:hypothetical protein
MAYANQEESVVWSGLEANIGDVFTIATTDPDSATAYPIERTDKCTNDIVAQYLTISTAGRADILVLTVRPAQGIKLYIDPNNANANAANTNALTVKTWNGSSMAAVTTLVDGTSKLTTTGTLSFDTTVGTAVPKHYQERYLYAYQISVTASSGTSTARIYQITVDQPMQAPTNVWDGIYRQPIQAQRYDNGTTSYEDFTLHVQESSTVATPVGLYMGQLAAADHGIIMFEEQMAAIKLVMLGSLVNTADAQFPAAGGWQYWDGDSWANLTFTDETLDAAGDSSCSQSGLIHWSPPSDEEKTTLFGTIGYAYRFDVDAAFTGSENDDVTIDLITGIPASEDLNVFKFPVQYKNKLMWCGYVEGNEGNRIDYSADNSPDVYNGSDSSMNGFQSVYVGSLEEITCATQLYNRFGSNLFSSLVLLKNNEVWLMTGDSPLDYKLFPVSFRLGCPAPYTLTTAEVGFSVGEDVERNIAMWISHQGPVMFDGAIIKPINGIENFFDPNESEVVNWTYIDTAQAWYDGTYNEWNILLPTGSSTTLNRWLVYSVQFNKWFEKDVKTADKMYCGIPTITSNGLQIIYGGSNDGRLYRLEVGTDYNGSNIVMSFKTADIFPSGNPWDITLLRRLKLVVGRLTGDDTTVNVYYHPDTENASGVSTTFQDVTASNSNSGTIGVSFEDVDAADANSGTEGVTWGSAPVAVLDLSVNKGLQRLIRTTVPLNYTKWSHGFTFEFISDEAGNQYKPIMWGYEWYYVRKDYYE